MATLLSAPPIPRPSDSVNAKARRAAFIRAMVSPSVTTSVVPASWPEGRSTCVPDRERLRDDVADPRRPVPVSGSRSPPLKASPQQRSAEADRQRAGTNPRTGVFDGHSAGRDDLDVRKRSPQLGDVARPRRSMPGTFHRGGPGAPPAEQFSGGQTAAETPIPRTDGGARRSPLSVIGVTRNCAPAVERLFSLRRRGDGADRRFPRRRRTRASAPAGASKTPAVLSVSSMDRTPPSASAEITGPYSSACLPGVPPRPGCATGFRWARDAPGFRVAALMSLSPLPWHEFFLSEIEFLADGLLARGHGEDPGENLLAHLLDGRFAVDDDAAVRCPCRPASGCTARCWSPA